MFNLKIWRPGRDLNPALVIEQVLHDVQRATAAYTIPASSKIASVTGLYYQGRQSQDAKRIENNFD